jgi:site-specific recombinase XerD
VRSRQRWRRRYRLSRSTAFRRSPAMRTRNWRLVTAFLVGYPPNSSRAYFSDLKGWYVWCAEMGVHPLAARRHHVDVWVRQLSQEPQAATGRPASPASIARRLSCLSKFYDYGIKDAELLEHSPVANVRRPKVSDDSSTVGLTAAELDRLLSAAEAHGPRSAALVSLLVYNGLRIAEILAATSSTSPTSAGTVSCGSCARAASPRPSHSPQPSCARSRPTSASALRARSFSTPAATHA